MTVCKSNKEYFFLKTSERECNFSYRYNLLQILSHQKTEAALANVSKQYVWGGKKLYA